MAVPQQVGGGIDQFAPQVDVEDGAVDARRGTDQVHRLFQRRGRAHDDRGGMREFAAQIGRREILVLDDQDRPACQ